MMKRLTFFLAMTLSCLFAKAQDWTPVDEYRYNDETIVYARLATGDDVADNDPSRFRVGAFIDGECRGTANATQGENGTYIYVVRVHGDSDDAELLIVGFGGTYGHLYSAMEELRAQGHRVALAHFEYINPLPANTAEVLKKYPKVVVAEQNLGQFAAYLRTKVDAFVPYQFNQVKGQPFVVAELVKAFDEIIKK